MFAFSGCASALFTTDDSVRVTLIKSEYYEIADGGDMSAVIRSGEDACFSVVAKSGFYVADTDCSCAEIEYGTGGLAKIVFHAVQYNLRVKLFCEKKIGSNNGDADLSGADPKDDPYNNVENPGSIRYYANGGRYFESEASYEAEIILNGHIRPNTDIGTDKIYRDGYTLLCWNTEPDGGGASYGLGSRCDVPKDKQLRLYAQWARWSPASDFTVINTGGKCRISSYNGADNDVCIPESIDGITITGIAAEAFSNKRLHSVVLPKSMEKVEDDAFCGSTVDELWFFDNLAYISDAAFRNSPDMPTIHINAILAPRYTKLDRHSNYTDKVDILRSHEHEKKIVIFGGSGALFSVDSSMIYEAFGGEYRVVNMAINAWFPATAQTEIILNYIHEGDIFLHLPEMASPVQLFCFNSFAAPNNDGDPDGYDDRYMSTFENNYDVLTSVDPDNTPGILDSFTRFNAERADKKEASYTDNPGCIDEYGDYSGDKPRNRYDYTVSGEAEIRSDYLTDEALDRLDLLYSKVREKGATPYLGYAAVNVSALEVSDNDNGTHYLDKEAAEYEKRLRAKIKNADIIEDLEQAYYTGSWFFNTDWHLSDEGAAMNTDVLVACLKRYMGRV